MVLVFFQFQAYSVMDPPGWDVLWIQPFLPTVGELPGMGVATSLRPQPSNPIRANTNKSLKQNLSILFNPSLMDEMIGLPVILPLKPQLTLF
jgi:hypothetical protein